MQVWWLTTITNRKQVNPSLEKNGSTENSTNVTAWKQTEEAPGSNYEKFHGEKQRQNVDFIEESNYLDKYQQFGGLGSVIRWLEVA